MKELSILISLSKAIENHKEVISLKESSIQKALEILDEHNDRYSELIADLKALSIFLENRLKD